MRAVLAAAALGFLLLLTACGESAPVLYDGRELSDEELAAFVKTTQTEAASLAVNVRPFDEDADISREDRVYWVEGGSVWHTSLDCRYLSASEKTRIYGTEGNAIASGKKRICSACEDNK